jgi:hypothetical protein
LEKKEVMMLCHLAGIIAAEELRKLRSKKLRKRWKDRTAMKINCFRNRRKIMTRAPFTDRNRNKRWGNVSRRKT